ncbi:MAG: RNA methyltransferase [Proteobacteria bacterium]|nr:RNA methyltransferase [Pseudomonadota bacterium]
MLENIRVVLVNPSHPGNIGAVARAIKNMGLSRLYLVAPEKFPHPEATFRAVGADDILKSAVVTDNLGQALADCHLVYGTSARTRHLGWPLCGARECAQQIVALGPQQQVAVVFGRESSGLTNQELAYCNYHVHIPTAPDFSSINLAAAVQICAYEIYMAHQPQSGKMDSEQELPATNEQILGFYTHLESTLINIGFLNPHHPKKLMQRIKRLFSRAQIDHTEINILRGVLTAIDKML